MRTVLVGTATALLGFIVGWVAHPSSSRETVRYVVQPAKAPASAVVKAAVSFPERPKPPLDSPEPIAGNETPPRALSGLAGELPSLPAATGATDLAPITPVGSPKTSGSADLNADEALVRRVVLRAGGEIVSSADAQDTSGKVGRSLVAEIAPTGLGRLRSSLRESLGARAVLSDGGSVGGSSTEVRKAEDELNALKRQLERAQDDFLPNAPALRNVEDAYREGERNLSEVRRTYARQRLNILLRSGLSG